MHHKEIKFSKYKFAYLLISIVLIFISVLSIYIKKINWGIEFVGGTSIEFYINQDSQIIDHSSIDKFIKSQNYENFIISKIDDEHSNHFIITLKYYFVDSGHKAAKILLEKLNAKYSNCILVKTDYMGPQVSQELLKSGIYTLIYSLAGMFLYLTWRFDWSFALGGTLSLIHDVIITLGMLSITAIELNLSTVAGLLTIVGYSINDTVVIYDRVRESIKENYSNSINKILDHSINKTLRRTMLTSITTLASAVVLMLLSGNSLLSFSSTVICGIIIGTYSSIFIGPYIPFYKIPCVKSNVRKTVF